eukprot:ctg_1343.g611
MSVAADVEHVCFLVHGLHGSPRDFRYMEWALHQTHPGVRVHAVRCNERRTHDGVDAGGQRVAREVQQVLQQCGERVQYVSLVGYSLGGLYVRRAVVDLVDERTGRIAGARAHTLMLVTVPHLGVRSYGLWRYLPRWLLRVAAGWLVGRTGRELMLADAADTPPGTSNEPILLRMATDRRYQRALQVFAVRVLVGNVAYDWMVNAGTALSLARLQGVVAVRAHHLPHARRLRQLPQTKIWHVGEEHSLEENAAAAAAAAKGDRGVLAWPWLLAMMWWSAWNTLLGAMAAAVALSSKWRHRPQASAAGRTARAPDRLRSSGASPRHSRLWVGSASASSLPWAG